MARRSKSFLDGLTDAMARDIANSVSGRNSRRRGSRRRYDDDPDEEHGKGFYIAVAVVAVILNIAFYCCK